MNYQISRSHIPSFSFWGVVSVPGDVVMISSALSSVTSSVGIVYFFIFLSPFYNCDSSVKGIVVIKYRVKCSKIKESLKDDVRYIRITGGVGMAAVRK